MRAMPVAVFVLGVSLLPGCASTPPPLEIDISGDGFWVSGRALGTQAELTDAIRASGATECRVVPLPTTAYEQVFAAVSAARDAGCGLGIVGNVRR